MDFLLTTDHYRTDSQLTDDDWARLIDPNHKIVRKMPTVRRAAQDRRVLDFMIKVVHSL